MKHYFLVTLDCKHCNNKTTHNLIGIYGTFITFPEKKGYSDVLYSHEGDFTAFLECRTCKKPSIVEGEGEVYTGREKHFSLIPTYEGIKYYDDGDYSYGDLSKLIQTPSLKIKYPINANVPMPSPDMPKEIANDYIEARTIFDASPRSSAALLRLALQKLCMYLGRPGKNINEDIRALVKAGLSPEVENVLDTIRIIGNNAVHPGTLNVAENPDMVEPLFILLNFIVEETITQPRIRKELYDKLPKKGL